MGEDGSLSWVWEEDKCVWVESRGLTVSTSKRAFRISAARRESSITEMSFAMSSSDSGGVAVRDKS